MPFLRDRGDVLSSVPAAVPHGPHYFPTRMEGFSPPLDWLRTLFSARLDGSPFEVF